MGPWCGPINVGLLSVSGHLWQPYGNSEDLRKNHGQSATRHPIRLTMLHHAMQMQRQRPKRRIIRVRQRINDSMQAIPPNNIIANLRRLDQLRVVLIREQRVGEFAEEEFEQVRGVVDVVVEGFRVAEVEALARVVEEGFELLDLVLVARDAIDAFVVEAEDVDGLDALVDLGTGLVMVDVSRV